jgi:hypothetical protein
MQNIGKFVFRYADAKCHLWNAYFRENIGDLSACEPLDSFEAIDRRLFFALVCEPLGIEYDYLHGTNYLEGVSIQTRSVEQIVVRPKPIAGPEISILIGEKQVGNTAWHKLTLATAGLSFAFVELFQWDMYGFLNLPMVRCRIAACAEHPKYAAEDALIDIDRVEFFLSDAKTTDENQ